MTHDKEIIAKMIQDKELDRAKCSKNIGQSCWAASKNGGLLLLDITTLYYLISTTEPSLLGNIIFFGLVFALVVWLIPGFAKNICNIKDQRKTKVAINNRIDDLKFMATHSDQIVRMIVPRKDIMAIKDSYDEYVRNTKTVRMSIPCAVR